MPHYNGPRLTADVLQALTAAVRYCIAGGEPVNADDLRMAHHWLNNTRLARERNRRARDPRRRQEP